MYIYSSSIFKGLDHPKLKIQSHPLTPKMIEIQLKFLELHSEAA